VKGNRGNATLGRVFRFVPLLLIILAYTCVIVILESGVLFMCSGDACVIDTCESTHRIQRIVGLGSMLIALILYVWALVAISRTWLRRSLTRYRFGSLR